MFDFPIEDETIIVHYGMPRRSGRYPWGSGEHPYQSLPGFYNAVKALKDEGYTEKEIAEQLNMSTRDLRSLYSASKEQVYAELRAQALKLKEKGWSNQAIAEKLGLSGESTVRNLVKEVDESKQLVITQTADSLKKQLETNKYLDVGLGTENYIQVSRTKLDASLALLQSEGYEIYNIDIKQLGGSGKYTTTQVLCPPGTTFKDVVSDYTAIGTVAEWYDSDKKTMLGIETPTSVNSDRVMISYKEDGGDQRDGLIQIRRGVEDLNMGDSQYAQVRIQVDDTHYIKGMAVYSDNMPDGVDIIFNTSKSKEAVNPDTGNKYGDNKLESLKSLKDDADNPFGATITKQNHYISADGTEKLSAVNIVNDEGDWGNWKKTVSAQMLSKQSPDLARKQLALKEDSLQEEYDYISEYTNSAIKKDALLNFAETCDSAAVHLEAAAFKGQASKVILPESTLADNEIYAPTYNNGETVVLIRYPHGGKFEIPELVVNNKNVEAKKTIGLAEDAVCINSNVAARLSGADFDGDTVLVIPNNNGAIKTQKVLEGLKDYDPKTAYPGYKGMKVMTEPQKQQEMGKITNLIADMTIQGADENEIARAVRHSMVVIDAVKHELDYETSYKDNGIAQLKEKYQGSARSGASTLITRSTSPEYVEPRKTVIDKETGEKNYIYTEKGAKQRSTKGAEHDPYELTSDGAGGTKMEQVYAEHATRLHNLANKARKEAVNLATDKVNQSAKETYKAEVASLTAKLNESEKNAPLERLAQRQANMIVRAKRAAGEIETNDDYKKVSQQALSAARERVGAGKKKREINITPKEWEAIQANALTATTVTKIINNANKDQINEYLRPSTDKIALTDAKKARIKAMINAGCTQAEVAEIIGVSTSTISRVLKE